MGNHHSTHWANIVALLIFLIIAGLALLEDSISQTAAPIAEIALHPYVGSLKSVQVTAGGDTLPFILDTGGGFTIITPDVAGKTGCVPFGRLTGFRHNGERIETQRCGETTLGFGSTKVSLETAVFDLMAVLKQSGDLPTVGGLVALNLLEKHPATLDYANNKLILESAASLKKRILGMNPLSVRLSRQGGGAAVDLFVEVKAKTGTLWLELDSGNNGPVLLSRHAMVQLRLDPNQNSLPVTLDIVGLGPVKCEAAVSDLIYDGLLNSNFFTETILTMDLAVGKAWAKRHSQ